MIERIIPYLIVFVAALVASLILTPLVRELNRRLGMVDKPDARRINKVPIPRGGGLAVFLAVLVTMVAYLGFTESAPAVIEGGLMRFWKMTALSALLVAIGYADDKFSLAPKLKLAGQVLVAFLVWWWVGLGFADIIEWLPTWLDAIITIFWIVGAVNAFNLIDGMDGLASGLSLIATLGMLGALFFSGHFGGVIFYFAFAGAILGFLRYNYNPASVFLGDSGSMYLGLVVSTLPLNSHAHNSFLVSIGVPLLAMGVPIFDTSLAIIRRSIRHLLKKGGDAEAGNDKVMTADTDHLHHRILRSVGFNQRKAAWILYLTALALVATGIIGISLESRAGGLWLVAVAVATAVIFHDISRIELFDAGVLLANVAHTHNIATRRKLARLYVPIMLVADVTILVGAFIFICWTLKIPITVRMLKTTMPIRVAATFGALVFFRTYVTLWSRAMLSNYMRLLLACAVGAIVGSVAVYYIPSVPASRMKIFTLSYGLLTFFLLITIRVLRPLMRDVLYMLDSRRLVMRKDVSRVLVYGCGLRYRAFRRELVRTAAKNSRIIVGLIDDDLLMRNQYIGGIKICGTLFDAPRVINDFNINEVIIACDVTEDWLKVVKETLAPTGVALKIFSFEERTL